MNVRQLVQGEIFNSEIDAAEELHRKGYYRPSGMLTGVVLESHLKEVLSRHRIKLNKNTTISSLNDKLKNNSIIEIPTWRIIQGLGDIRNICCHKKEREPTKDDSLQLINGVKKIIKTVQ